MAFTDVINDYTNGATGTLTDVNGFTIDYTVSGTSSNVNWNGLSGGAKVNGNGTQSFTVTLEYPATGVAIQMSGSDTTEAYYIEIDGVTVDLQQMVDNGEATFTTDGTHVLRPDGGINGGHYSDGSIAVIVFNVPVTSIGAYGSGASSGNWDYFEVGIDSTAFDVVCLASGTEITTAGTAVRVEDLVIGDLVKTHENGYAPVSWTGSRHVTAEVLSKEPRLRRFASRPVPLATAFQGAICWFRRNTGS